MQVKVNSSLVGQRIMMCIPVKIQYRPIKRTVLVYLVLLLNRILLLKKDISIANTLQKKTRLNAIESIDAELKHKV